MVRITRGNHPLPPPPPAPPTAVPALARPKRQPTSGVDRDTAEAMVWAEIEERGTLVSKNALSFRPYTPCTDCPSPDNCIIPFKWTFDEAAGTINIYILECEACQEEDGGPSCSECCKVVKKHTPGEPPSTPANSLGKRPGGTMQKAQEKMQRLDNDNPPRTPSDLATHPRRSDTTPDKVQKKVQHSSYTDTPRNCPDETTLPRRGRGTVERAPEKVHPKDSNNNDATLAFSDEATRHPALVALEDARAAFAAADKDANAAKLQEIETLRAARQTVRRALDLVNADHIRSDACAQARMKAKGALNAATAAWKEELAAQASKARDELGKSIEAFQESQAAAYGEGGK